MANKKTGIENGGNSLFGLGDFTTPEPKATPDVLKGRRDNGKRSGKSPRTTTTDQQVMRENRNIRTGMTRKIDPGERRGNLDK